MRITLPLPPLLNRMYRPIVVRGHSAVALTKAGRRYKTDVALACTLAKCIPFPGPVCVSLQVFRPRNAGDIDSTLKGLLDSLQGHVYVKDSQVTELHVYLHKDKYMPRVEVLASPAFDGTEQSD